MFTDYKQEVSSFFLVCHLQTLNRVTLTKSLLSCRPPTRQILDIKRQITESCDAYFLPFISSTSKPEILSHQQKSLTGHQRNISLNPFYSYCIRLSNVLILQQTYVTSFYISTLVVRGSTNYSLLHCGLIHSEFFSQSDFHLKSKRIQ